MYSYLGKTGLGAFVAVLLFFKQDIYAQPCPTLNQTATLNSSGCTPNATPCSLCPGEQFTLNATTGQGLQPGTCINWYYGITDTFNPYNGQGVLLGCALVQSTPPVPCDSCPSILALLIDACGTEENNEYFMLWSGSGFAVNDATLDFDAANNGPNAQDADIGSVCSWQEPDSIALSVIQTACPNAIVVGAGPGETIPPGVPVIVFTSAGFDFNYNFAGLCAIGPVIYVLQNGCTRTIGAFSNSTSSGLRTTTFGLNCGCSWSTTYDCGLLIGGDGAFVTDGGLAPLYANTGCNFPPVPGGSSGPPPIFISPFTATVTQSMCNSGPFWVVGVVDTLPAGCNQPLTNYVPFDVTCPTPVLSTADICQNTGLFDLTALADTTIPNGTWSGPGVSGTSFDPTGLSGAQVLTFLPNDSCNLAAATMVTVIIPPSASLTLAGSDTLCAGLTDSLLIDFDNGVAPFTFVYSLNGVLQAPRSTNADPFKFATPPLTTAGNVIIKLDSVVATGCTGTVSGIDTIFVKPAPQASIPTDTITLCPGQKDTLTVHFSGPGPYTFVYKIKGDTLPPVTTSDTLYKIPLVPDTGLTVVTLLSVSGGGCNGTVNGRYGIQVYPVPTAILSGDTTICAGEPAPLTLNFTGTGPFIVTYSANGALQTPDTTNFNPRVILANPDHATLYKLTGMSANGCPGTISGQAVVNVLPELSATISGGELICQGGSGTFITFTFNGPGPTYTFVYSAQSGETHL